MPIPILSFLPCPPSTRVFFQHTLDGYESHWDLMAWHPPMYIVFQGTLMVLVGHQTLCYAHY